MDGLAISVRPVPGSPSSSTGESDGATRSSRAKSCRMSRCWPITGPNALRSLGVIGTTMSPASSWRVERPTVISVPTGTTRRLNALRTDEGAALASEVAQADAARHQGHLQVGSTCPRSGSRNTRSLSACVPTSSVPASRTDSLPRSGPPVTRTRTRRTTSDPSGSVISTPVNGANRRGPPGRFAPARGSPIGSSSPKSGNPCGSPSRLTRTRDFVTRSTHRTT